MPLTLALCPRSSRSAPFDRTFTSLAAPGLPRSDHACDSTLAPGDSGRATRIGEAALPCARLDAIAAVITPTASPLLPFCLLIPAGPGPAEIARITDLLEACAAYANRPLCAFIINDGNDAAALEQAGAAQRIPTTVRPNVRAGRGNWWTGGLCMAMVDALLWIAWQCPCCGVLRLDSDAMVINPFADRLVALFEADPLIGIVGNGDSPSGNPPAPGHSLTAMLYWKSKSVSYDREQGKIIVSLWGWRRRIRHLIHRAQAHGYVLGDWCQGGAYAVSPAFLARLREDPFFARPDDFLPLDFCEDVLMILIVHALGLHAHYTTGPDRLFASKWKGLYAAPEVLAQAGHGVVHSIKQHGDLTEADIRAFFRARRSATFLADSGRVQPSPAIT